MRQKEKKRESNQNLSSKDKNAKKPPKKGFEERRVPSEKPIATQLPDAQVGACDAYTFSDLFPLLDESSLDGPGEIVEAGTLEREVSAEHGIPLSVISRPGRMSQDTDEIQIEEKPKPQVSPERQRRRWYELD